MTSTSRRVFGPKDNHLFSTQSSASCWLFEDPPPENNDFKTILESFRRIVGQQRQEVMLFSENLLFDRIFTTQREALVQWMTEVGREEESFFSFFSLVLIYFEGLLHLMRSPGDFAPICCPS